MLPTKKREIAFSPFPGTSLVRDGLESYHRRGGQALSPAIVCSPSAQHPERIVYKLLCSLCPLSSLKITHCSHRIASVSTPLFAVKKDCEFLSLTELSRGQLPPVSPIQVSFLTIYCEFMTFIGQRRCFLALCKCTDSPSTKKI